MLQSSRLSSYLAILSEVDALILLEVICQEVNNALVKVVTSKVCVSTGAQHLKDSITHLPKDQVKQKRKKRWQVIKSDSFSQKTACAECSLCP